jgi:competence ComEA-like helix-hairpin-helix protein
MRLPFFRNSKAEPTKTVVAPQPSTARVQLADTQLIVAKDEGIEYPPVPRGASGNRPAPSPAGNGSSIPLPLNCIFQQLPAQLLAPNAREQMDRATIRIPADWVLSQLSAGKVSLSLGELLPLLPQSILRSPPPVTNGQQPITLPLEEIVSALPANLLAHQNQTTLDIDTPEFDKLPKLFDDEEPAQVEVKDEPAAIVEPAIVAPSPTTEIREETVPLASPPPAFFVAPSPALPPINESSPDTSPLAPSDADDKVMVSLRSLVAVMPDQFFACPRTELWRRIDLDSRVPLPRDIVLPQLQTARVRIPLAVVVEAIPTSILASPLPSIGNESVPLALQEIVPQLPPGLFATAALPSDEETIDFSESEIPMPFTEKAFAAEVPEVEAPAPTEAVTPEQSQPEQQLQPEPEPESKVFEVSTEVFADEGLSIFAEKTETPEPIADVQVESQPQPEPTPAFVSEANVPAIEPEVHEEPIVAEIKPEEPVAEIVPPTPELAPIEVSEVLSTEQPAAPVESVTKPDEPVAEIVPPTPELAPIEVPEVLSTEQPAAPIESVTKPDEPVAEIVPPTPAPAPIEVSEVPSTEQPAAPIESVTEPVAITPSAAEIPAIPEAVTEVVPPVEQPALAASVAPTENKFLVNLNQCTADDLAKIEGVGPVLAQRIIEFRNARGGFKSPKELRHVPGINRKILRTLTGPAPRTLNRLLKVEHNEELTLQEIVRLTSQLKGVAGCILAMSDGVFLTGQLPPHLDQETISVFAPQLFKKVGRYMKELRVGQVTRLSVFTDQQPLSIFHAGEIFLVVIHDPSHFSKALLRRCERISQEIARACRQRAVV